MDYICWFWFDISSGVMSIRSFTEYVDFEMKTTAKNAFYAWRIKFPILGSYRHNFHLENIIFFYLQPVKFFFYRYFINKYVFQINC